MLAVVVALHQVEEVPVDIQQDQQRFHQVLLSQFQLVQEEQDLLDPVV